jgi:uncharacterized protein (TIGR02453 family)
VAFEGFPKEGLAFLAALAEHNDRAWFEEHRDTYERCLLEPARDFVVETGEELARRGIDVHAEPRVNGSIFRINRDTRFSKDKRPYKTHLDLWLWQGDGPSRRCPGFFFRLRPDALVLGAGRHHLEPEPLDRFRQAAADTRTGEALVEAVERVEAAGFTLGGERYKRVPAGFAAEGRRADLLRHEGLFAYEDVSPPPPETRTAGFPAFCAERFARLEPLQAWVVANV